MRGPGNWLRRTRVGLLGGFACLLLGAVGHVAAGGHLPDATGLAGIFAVLAVVCGALHGLRRHRFAVSTVVLGSVQGVLHFVFHAMAGGHTTAGGHGGMRAQPPAHGAHAGHAGHHGMPMPDTDAATEAASEVSGHTMDPGMSLAHTFAALGTAVCLVQGERVLQRLAALLLRPLLRIGAPSAVPVPPGQPEPGPDDTLPVLHGVLLSRVHPRRGPPMATYA
ncbi:hypothetical protein [Streptomyces sp. ERV7]|uniref:hypothetical protein n=1 Tax=Streptomyces sp. ERV7 TaxID=1322334 RepID=UPI0009A08325|nr:hypothetical protein [Streptomyces sp. ERV7]